LDNQESISDITFITGSQAVPMVYTKIGRDLNQGGGEPPIITIGAVVANAIFDTTGARVYQLPMSPERVLEAIRKG
jgi:CO/xanthine dehydrogenase Mo-binding subunit